MRNRNLFAETQPRLRCIEKRRANSWGRRRIPRFARSCWRGPYSVARLAVARQLRRNLSGDTEIFPGAPGDRLSGSPCFNTARNYSPPSDPFTDATTCQAQTLLPFVSLASRPGLLFWFVVVSLLFFFAARYLLRCSLSMFSFFQTLLRGCAARCALFLRFFGTRNVRVAVSGDI